MKIKTLVTVGITAVIALSSFALPAHADGFSVALSASSGLDNSGETISVSLSGVPEGDGFYVRYCQAPATEGVRPTLCNGMGAWVSSDSTSLSMGASSATAPISVNAVPTFTASGTAVDCATTSCGVFVRRDHLASGDTSFDSFTPVSFAGTYGVAVDPVTSAPRSGSVAVTISGVTHTQGVYVRLCQAPAEGIQRPTNCDGMGVWASKDATSVSQGATLLAGTVSLPVHATFTANGQTVKCGVVVCGVFVRRDHLNGADLTLDSFTPLTFAPVPPVQGVTKLSGRVIAITILNQQGRTITFTVAGRKYVRTPSTATYVFRVTVPAGVKKAVVRAARGSGILLNKTVAF